MCTSMPFCLFLLSYFVQKNKGNFYQNHFYYAMKQFYKAVGVCFVHCVYDLFLYIYDEILMEHMYVLPL